MDTFNILLQIGWTLRFAARVGALWGLPFIGVDLTISQGRNIRG